MSTRGRIGIVLDDGKVASIYNHWDSYPSFLGCMLSEHYTDKGKVEKLISNGDCSSVGEEVDIPEGKTHSFDNPLDGVTVFCMRDRGEDGCEARIDDCEESFWKSDIEEWGYLFKDGKWFFATSHGTFDDDGNYVSTPADKRIVMELTEENIQNNPD